MAGRFALSMIATGGMMFDLMLLSADLVWDVQISRPPCIPRYVDQHIVFYPSGVADLDEARANRVATAAEYIDPDRGPVVIIARTDTHGAADDNLRLSQERADIVVAELVRLGIPRAIMEVKVVGEAELARRTADDVSEPLNRMVHIETGPLRPSTRAALFARDCPGR